MKVLGVVGAGATALVDRLARRLGSRGRVATVERADEPSGDVAPGAAATYRLAGNGWTAAGTDRALAETLDDLAPTYDYALLAGFPDARVPHASLGGADHDGERVVAAESAEAVDLDAVVEALRDVESHVTLETLVRRAKASPDAEFAGAIATFTGRVRAREDGDDAPTSRLEFEKYEGVADERMAALCEELESRDGVHEVLTHHRTGVVEYGEDIVFVVVLAGHREEAFRTVEDGIDRLKDEVPLFKKEVTVDEEFWVHDR